MLNFLLILCLVVGGWFCLAKVASGFLPLIQPGNGWVSAASGAIVLLCAVIGVAELFLLILTFYWLIVNF